MHTNKISVTAGLRPLVTAISISLVLASQLACDTKPAPEAPPSPAVSIPQATLAAPSLPAPAPAAALVAEAPSLDTLVEPTILSRRERTPRGGPSWLAIRAEIIERDGKRLLRTSEFSKDIKNASLAQQTAANRARHELTRWLGTPTLKGAVITDSHWNQKKRLSAARIEIELPASWAPPQREQRAHPREDPTQP